jgi:hypothetical protein
MRKTYIDGKEDVIQYAFRNGQIVKKAATGDALGEDIYDVELFKKGLNNMMAGGGFTVPPRCQRIPNKQRIGSCQFDLQ